jgi:hypothetical protein
MTPEKHISRRSLPGRMSRSGSIRLAAMVGVVFLAVGCEEAADDNGSNQAYCPQADPVTVSNGTGRHIRDLEIRLADETAAPYRLLEGGAGLAPGAEVSWRPCSGEPQALLITLDDGTVERGELPTLSPSTRRLTLVPGSAPRPSDPPGPEPSGGRQIGLDPVGGSVPIMVR